VIDLLQVMSLMAVPVIILGTIGYLNRRANRQPLDGAAEWSRGADTGAAPEAVYRHG
jgi:hypothetical protein